MSFDLIPLLILQHRDSELASLEQDVKRFPTMEQQAKERLTSATESVAQAKKALQELEKNTAAVELDVQTRCQTIARLTQQQFETRKNEEYQAIGHEIEHYTREIDALETKELELMELADEARAKLKEEEARMQRVKASVDAELAALDNKLANARARLKEIRAKRAEDASKVEDKPLLDLYERLQKNHPGKAIAEVTEEALCLGCHMKVTPSTYLRVQKGRELVQCESCSRIIHPGLLAPIEDEPTEEEED